MKKLFITLLVLFSFTSFAQNHFVGAQVGLNSSRAYGADHVKDDKYYNSFSSGLHYNYKLENSILLGSALLYSCIGTISEDFYLNEVFGQIKEVDVKSRLYYLEVPLKAGYQFGKNWSGFFYVGIVPAYLLKANHSKLELIRPGVYETDKFIDNTESLFRFSLSALFEVGSNYQVNERWGLFLLGRYEHGLTEVYKYAKKPYVKYFNFNISLGVKYALKSE